MATIAFLLVLWIIFLAARRYARLCAQRRLDGHLLTPPPRRRRVPPPVTQARLLLSAGEWPTAAVAMLAGRRTRARLRLILAMRRDQALDRYYERLGQLPSDDEVTIDLYYSPSPPSRRPARVKTPDAFEDPAGALEFAITAMFAVPPAALGNPAASMPLVVHLKPRDYGDQKIRRSWVEADYLLSPYLDGHPVGVPCGVCAQANILAARQAGTSVPTYRPDDDRWLL